MHDSHLELTDVLQERLGRVIPLSLHAPPKHHEQTRRPLGEAEAVLLVGLDILGCHVGWRAWDKLESWLLTAMIWRMARRTVATAIMGGNCNTDEISEAIWAEVTIQSTALLPVLRLMALRDMKITS